VQGYDIGFLLSDVSRLMRREFDARARAIGITRAQWKALTALKRHEGINQGGLADLLEVVERRRDPADRRAWKIFLTDRSRPLIDQLRALADDVIGDALSVLTPAEQAAMVDALSRIRTNLHSSDLKDTAHG
jgi:DNA-binding MarR family transcriptional regulator